MSKNASKIKVLIWMNETWVGRVFFSTVVVCERLDWSYPSIPALNLMCSNSWAIASLDGNGFFSIVSAFFRLDLSNSETVLREESLASSVCRMAVGEAGSLVRTSFRLSFAKPSTPWRKENIKEEVTTIFADLEHSLDRLLSLDLLLARQHHLLLRLCRLQGVGGEALDSSEDSLVVLLLLHVLRCRQHILLSWVRRLQFEVTSKQLPVEKMWNLNWFCSNSPLQSVANEHLLGKLLHRGGGSGHPYIWKNGQSGLRLWST